MKYIVSSKVKLNFRIKNTTCVSGAVVDLNPDDYLVGLFVKEGSLLPYDDSKSQKKEKA